MREMSKVDVLAVMDSEIQRAGGEAYQAGRDLIEASAAVAELIDCIADAQCLLSQIDDAVRAEHSKNGHPKSKSVAGIINERITAALARCRGEA